MLLASNTKDGAESDMPVELPSSAVLTAYVRHRVDGLLAETDEQGRPRWKQISLAKAVGVNRSQMSLFVKGDLGAGPKFIRGLLPILNLTRDQLDAAALAWAKERGIPLDEITDPYPNRVRAVAAAKGELDDRAIRIVESLDPGEDMPFRWWYVRLLLEHDQVAMGSSEYSRPSPARARKGELTNGDGHAKR